MQYGVASVKTSKPWVPPLRTRELENMTSIDISTRETVPLRVYQGKDRKCKIFLCTDSWECTVNKFCVTSVHLHVICDPNLFIVHRHLVPLGHPIYMYTARTEQTEIQYICDNTCNYKIFKKSPCPFSEWCKSQLTVYNLLLRKLYGLGSLYE